MIDEPTDSGGSDQASGSEPVRLQKILAVRGFGSRRIVEELIEEGRVTVNGTMAELGRRVDVTVDKVEVDGVHVGLAPDQVWYLLNKPAGVLCSASDPQGRQLATEIVPAEPRVWTVGRLDYETEGLLLLTNDGDLTHQLTHPSFGVEKEYIVELDRPLSRGDLRTLREGVELDDGVTSPAKASAVADHVLRLTIHEGRNRQVRRMCESLGFRVQRLVRSRIGPLMDRHLAPGEWRELDNAEIRKLAEAVSASASKHAG